MGENKNNTGQDKGISQIQAHEKRGWPGIAFIWIGTMICIPMLMVGGIFAETLTVPSILGVTVAGFAVCCLLMVLGGIVGSDLGLNSSMTSTRAFGMTGANFTMALVVFIAEAGWFAVQTATCAVAFNTLLEMSGVTFPFWASCTLWGAVMCITAVYGVRWMTILNYVAVPLLLILCVYGAVHSINEAGWSAISDTVTSNTMAIPAAISTVIGLFALGATCNSDYTRYCKSRGDVVKATVLGVLPAATIMIMVGAIMALGTGNYDVTAMFAGLGLPVVSMLVLVLATWTTNTGNAYMSGLAACKMFSVKDRYRPAVTMVVGVLGIIMAVMGLADVLNTYISIIGAVVPPIMGIIIADYWVICRGKAENWKPVRGINWIGIIAWICGGGFALIETLGILTVFSPALDGVVIAFAAYVVFYRLLGNTALAGKGEMTIEEATASAR
ncbi:MAG TPA: cytosine permease [Candidatus Copromorpha excrementigallinarum]|uniref:Cytosine permease n=1 Tax=Candidatus Allocopromorpha excrementigallinarum TaxID=2840742 RepID=A0A9D1I2D7_9FIRM|nr:cytosine permease [Candidatus Copromorpha excrementigallinarum]